MPSWGLAGKLFKNISGYLTEMNPATLTGAIDVIIIRQEDGSFQTSPWHVRFGKMGCFWVNENSVKVDIEINGQSVDMTMKLGVAGEAFFLHDISVASELINNNNNKMNNNAADNAATSVDKGMPLQNNNNSNNYDLLQAQNTPQQQPQQQQQIDSVDKNDNETPSSSSTTTTTTLAIATTTLTKARSSDDIMFELELEEKQQSTTTTTTTTTTSSTTSTTTTTTTTNERQQHRQFPTNDVAIELNENPTLPNLSLLRCNSWPDICNITTVEDDPQPSDLIEEELKCIVGSLPNDYLSQTAQSSNSLTTPAAAATTKPLQQLLTAAGDIDDVDWKWGQLPETGSHLQQQHYQQQMLQQQEQQQQQQQQTQDNNITVSNTTAISSSSGSNVAGSSGSSSNNSSNDTKSKTNNSCSSKDTSNNNKLKSNRNKDKTQVGIYLEDLDSEDPELVNLYLYNNSKTLYQHHQQQQQSQNHLTVDNNNTRGESETVSGGFPNFQSPSSLPDSPVSFSKEDVGRMRVRAKSCSADNEEEYLNSRRLSTLQDLQPPFPLSQTHLPPQPPSQQTQSSSSSSSSHFGEIKLSLCGGGLDEMAGERFEKELVTHEALSANPNLLNNPNLVVKLDGKYFKWAVAAPMIMSILIFNQPLADSAKDLLIKTYMSKKERRGWLGGWWGGNKEKSPHSAQESSPPPVPTLPSTSSSSSRNPELVKDGAHVVVNMEGTLGSGLTDSTADKSTTATTATTTAAAAAPTVNSTSCQQKYFKSLKITSDQIRKLNLKDGLNDAVFSITTKYQGTTKCTCSIFLWDWNDKIVVSDIDGTITKSDVLGQVLPIISNLLPTVATDWSQVGIANLYTLIHQNGYKFMYLSARAIGQSHYTREYLKGVRQGDYNLPVGPLLLSPSSLRSAFHKEVIERKPEEFKIHCLRNIRQLFPQTSTNPFTAGFGNRINDVWAYTTIGVPKSRIFIVDHTGKLTVEKSTFTSSYSKLSDIVDQLFPSVAVDTEYSTFNYWRRDPSLTFGKLFDEEEAKKFLAASTTSSSFSSAPTSAWGSRRKTKSK